MGENLNDKECGKDIYQRKDGLFSARYYAKDGKRKEKYFDTLPEAKNWLADSRYEERHNFIVTSPDMTVDKWFTYWVKNIAKHPMNGVRYTKPVRAIDDIKYLTIKEQDKFLEAAGRSHNDRQITGERNTPVSTGYAASFKKGRKKGVQEI